MRVPTPKGSDHPRARFSPEEVAQIRQRVANGETLRAVARDKGCDPMTIYRIAHRVSYR